MSQRTSHPGSCARLRFPASLVACGMLALSAAASPRPTADSSALYPAGSINSCFEPQQTTVIFEDLPEVAAHARGVAGQFFKGALLLTDEEAVEADLSGRSLVFYGTWKSAWIQKYRQQLPFRCESKRLHLLEQSFEGEHLRVICGLRNPQDRERRLVIYLAQKPGDITNINGIPHGPTEWLVADGQRTLDSGMFAVTLSPEQMRRDLKELTDLIGEVHPASLNGLPPAVRSAAEAASGKIERPMDRTAFTFLVNDILLSLHDAHSSAVTGLSGPSLALPLRWLQAGLVVSEDTDDLRIGDQIMSLGGLRPDELMDGLRRLIPAENDWWVRHRAERMLRNVAVLEHLGIATRPALEVRLFREGEAITTRIDPSARGSAGSSEQQWVRYELDPENSLGLFTLDQCTNNELYRQQLRQFFEEVHAQEISRIALDLRRNSGGNSTVCNEFLRYLDIDEYRDFGAEVRVSKAAIHQRGLSLEPGYVRHPASVSTNDRVPDLPPFVGELYILTSNCTFSGGNWFTVVVRDNDLGEVLGEPTGNSPSSFGDILSFSLHESGVSFTLSYKKFVRPARERDPADCLIPDLEIPVTIEDLLNGTDPVLEYLRE